MHSKRTAQSPRRPRARRPHPAPLTPSPPAPISLPAYAVPPPVLLAVATLSLAALRRLLRRTPTLSVRSLTQALRKHLLNLLPRPPPPPPLIRRTDHAARLDALRDRSIAEIDALQPVPDDYASLAPIQRRALLASALASAVERAAVAPRPPSRRVQPPPVAVVKDTKVVAKARGRVDRDFWGVAEQINGRAAALGFVLCLAREVAEPGHPSLFEQVVDVVVPIAQKTPPFLVAMVDRLVDLVT